GDAGVAGITGEIIGLRIHLDQVKMHKRPEEEGFGFNSIQFPLTFRKFLKKDRLIFEDIINVGQSFISISPDVTHGSDLLLGSGQIIKLGIHFGANTGRNHVKHVAGGIRVKHEVAIIKIIDLAVGAGKGGPYSVHVLEEYRNGTSTNFIHFKVAVAAAHGNCKKKEQEFFVYFHNSI